MMKSWLIDTNVLIYSFDQENQFHLPSFNFLSFSISDESSKIYLAQQNLLEFMSVVTNPKRVENPLSIEDAFQKLIIYQTSFPIICPLPETISTFSQLLKRYPTFRERIFDLYLVATALDNGIQQICTWNKKDFLKISAITVKTPEEILKEMAS